MKMGNVLSGDEKLSNFFASYDKKPRGIVWIDEQFGYRPANKSQRKAYDKRRSLYYNGNRDRITRHRSHSLGAIIGDFYTCHEDLRGSYHGLSNDNHQKFSRSFIPRIKLTKDMPIKEDIQYSSKRDTYRGSGGIHPSNTPTTSYKDQLILHEKQESVERRLPQTLSYPENDLNCEIMDKPEENYFTKNFDECIKRLQIIEKEQEIMEADGGRTLNVYSLKKPLKRQMTPPAEEALVLPPERDNLHQKETVTKEDGEDNGNTSCPEDCAEEIVPRANHTQESNNLSNEKFLQQKESSSDISSGDNMKSPGGWYSNLKKQFEGENRDSKSKESSCRVTGATLKNPTASTQTPDSDVKEVRHYFSRLVRSNKSLIDEELPDPDKVQNIRAMFQESLNSTLPKNFNNKFGGSLQNINVRPSEDQFARPKSAQGNRNDFAAEFGKLKKEDCGPASDGTQIYSAKQGPNPRRTTDGTASGRIQHDTGRNKMAESQANKVANRKCLLTKWTDTTSLSSGVSSDLSSYDTDAECCSREEIEDNTTDEELQDEEEDKHYIQNETLEKIRSFGTSVTYFGGQMITCSVGPLLSPTTQAILEEIGEKYPDRKSFTRTFEEFYRKYTENNEPRRKKLGRARSFGQSDVFHKPNILSNTEIEMYKNDLEVEIGIRKPSGKSQNTLKQKLVKSNSVGSRMEMFEQEVVDKLNEILEAAVEMAISGMNEKNNGTSATPENEISDETERAERQTQDARSAKGCEADDGESDGSAGTPAAKPNHSPAQPNGVHFGYEKSIFNKERKPDIEFEEFEVCETIEEKFEKLEDKTQSYRLTIPVNQKEEEEEALEEIIINDQDPLDSLEIYLKSRKTEEQSAEQAPRGNNSCRLEEETDEAAEEALENFKSDSVSSDLSKCCLGKPEAVRSGHSRDGTESNSVASLYAGSKWPIETTVMVDIQKNEELTPKLVTTGKSVVKTKTRSFKRQ